MQEQLSGQTGSSPEYHLKAGMPDYLISVARAIDMHLEAQAGSVFSSTNISCHSICVFTSGCKQ